MVAQAVPIRLCEERDLDRFGAFGSERHVAHCRQEFGRGPGLAILVAVDENDAAVGKLHLDFECRAADRSAMLIAAGVRPELRRRGIGTALMRAAEELVSSRGFRAIVLGVEDSSPAARRLYEGLGYEPFATDNFKYLGAPAPNPGVSMRKELE